MNHAKSYSRRRFLHRAAVGYTTLLTASRVLGANDDIRAAVIGLGGKGRQHARVLNEMTGVRLAALSDVDPKRLAEQTQRYPDASATTDPRRILDRRDIDVVVIATPDHWHALLAIWACQAGKDVYVEKPISHNIREGHKIIAAAAKYNRIV